MNFKLVARITGMTLLLEAVTMLLPMFVGMLYGETPVPFLFSIAITAAVGFALMMGFRKADHSFYAREGFFTVGLIWVLFGAFGALPFQFCGYFNHYIDCFFETISGFTTTGATILTEIESLPSEVQTGAPCGPVLPHLVQHLSGPHPSGGAVSQDCGHELV